jgi:hypothetical protein
MNMIGQERCNSLSNSAAAEQFRTRLNPSSAEAGSYGGYPPPPRTASPAQVFIGSQPPLTHSSSLRPNPPASAAVFSSSFELPFNTGKTQSAAEIRKKDFPAVEQESQRQRSPADDAPSHSPLCSARRPSRALGSLPPLVHRDSTLSSTTEELITPPILYQAHTLPPLDPAKADRTLPTQLPSIGASLLLSSYDTGIHKMSPTKVLQRRGTPPTTRITPFDALLRASEFAQDADFKYKPAKRGGGSV